MRRSLMLVLMAALAGLVLAPSALAQDDNPRGGDLGRKDPDGVAIYDDNLTGDDVMATPTATTTPSATPTATPTTSATPSAAATPGVSASPRAGAPSLPGSGGVPVLSVAAGILLVGAGIVAAMLMGRTS
jgi:hypothetical protein